MIRRFVFLLLDPFFCRQRPGFPRKGLLQPDFRLASFSCCWAPFSAVSGSILQTGVPRNLTSDLLPFPAAGPLFVPSAAWILQTGDLRNLTSELLPFPAAGPLFVPSMTAWILQKWAGHWCHLCCFRSHLFESLAAQRGCTYVISLCSFLCSWPWPSVWQLLYWYPASVSTFAEHGLYARSS